MAYTIACYLCRHWRRFQPDDEQYNKTKPHLGACSNELYEHDITGELGKCGEFEPNQEPTCQTCAFWTRHTMTLIGDCTSPKLVFRGNGIQIAIDGLGCWVPERARNFQTGETFGCIHHQPRT